MRNRRAIWQIILGAVLVALGGGYAVLPKDWIEQVLHLDPDGGNGVIEMLLPLALLAAGAALVLRAALRRRATAATTAPSAVDE
jgi:hypothetical protein